MTDQPTATARLEQLEQDAVAQAGALAELNTRLKAATDELAKQRNAGVMGHADGDPKAVEKAKKACRVSRDKLEELTMEVDGAKLRADRAREAAISFTCDNGRELIRDLEPGRLRSATACSRRSPCS